MIFKKQNKTPALIVIPPVLPEPRAEEVEECEKVGGKVVCRRRVERQKLLA
jgi:hypothetical protein